MNIRHQFTPASQSSSSLGIAISNSPLTLQPQAPLVPVVHVSGDLRDYFRAGNIDTLIRFEDFHKGDAIRIHTADGKRFIVGYWDGELMIKELDETPD